MFTFTVYKQFAFLLCPGLELSDVLPRVLPGRRGDLDRGVVYRSCVCVCVSLVSRDALSLSSDSASPSWFWRDLGLFAEYRASLKVE
jgi:hypothetical protein